MQVRFERVSKTFGAHAALRGVDLAVEPGECLVLLGPSGCGKTTLLRLLAGLETADEGRIFIGDREVGHLPPAERDVAMVFQNYALYPHLTAFENIAFPLRARRVPDADVEPRVRETARRLGLDGLLDRRPAQISGGQQQRVALARAIVRSPAVYLMDEPLSNLDAQLRMQTRTELKKLQQELGTTTLYVTHDQGEAMTMGSRVAVLRAGVVEQVAPPIELYRRPASRFVASFVGSPAINLWPAEVGAGGEVRAAGMAIPLPPETRAAITEASGLEVGLRAEDLRVSATAVPGAAEARVLVLEPMGNETIAVLEREGVRLVSRIAADLDLGGPGTPVWVSAAPGRALLFDAGGARIRTP